MSLENLAKTGLLKEELPDEAELEGLLRSGRNRPRDAANKQLALESQFDLAYNAAHALALAALRLCGYRPEKRYIVFQALPLTLELPAEQARVLAQAHTKRNAAEYDGDTDVDLALLEAVIRVTTEVEARLIAKM